MFCVASGGTWYSGERWPLDNAVFDNATGNAREAHSIEHQTVKTSQQARKSQANYETE